jgi:hypothetical protein
MTDTNACNIYKMKLLSILYIGNSKKIAYNLVYKNDLGSSNVC